jgi:SAM-dependent methyltransferase
MTAWYEQSFGETYLDLYAHRDEREARENVRALMALIAPDPEEPLLDLCCGAGRYLCALRELGFARLYGLDLSETMLDAAAEALAKGRDEIPCQIELIPADMRCIPFENHFGVVLSLFTSFGYFDDDAENLAVLQGVHRALKPGGVFVLDYMNRQQVIARLSPMDEQERGSRWIRNERRISPDGKRVEKTTTIRDAEGRQQVFFESVRLFSPEELVSMLGEVGFCEPALYGAFCGDPFQADSPRLIAICHKPQEPA